MIYVKAEIQLNGQYNANYMQLIEAYLVTFYSMNYSKRVIGSSFIMLKITTQW